MEILDSKLFSIIIFNFDDSERFKFAMKLREEIFIKEQNVSLELEFDGDDEKCRHVLMYYKTDPIGVMRLYSLGSDIVKFQRVGVLSQYRGLKLGEKMMKFVMDELINTGVKTFKLSAQVRVIGFYEKFGFKAYGDVHIDAGIEHKDVILEL